MREFPRSNKIGARFDAGRELTIAFERPDDFPQSFIYPSRPFPGSLVPVFQGLSGTQQLDGNHALHILHNVTCMTRTNGPHADMIFLVCRCRNGITARRMDERLVFRDQSRGGVLHDH